MRASVVALVAGFVLQVLAQERVGNLRQALRVAGEELAARAADEKRRPVGPGLGPARLLKHARGAGPADERHRKVLEVPVEERAKTHVEHPSEPSAPHRMRSYGSLGAPAMPSPQIDVDATLRTIATIADELRRKVALAVDHHQSFDARRAAAMEACELIASTGALDKLREAKAWIEKNREYVERGLRVGSFITALRGR